MTNWLAREELLLKKEGIEKLQNAHVMVIGLGGVGASAVEFLTRAGIGSMTIIDGDTVDLTNINRQLPAMRSTLGKSKVEVVAKRILDINPDLKLTVIDEFIRPERVQELLEIPYNCIVDCIDSITPKLELIRMAMEKNVPLVSSMGAGGKINAESVRTKDISKTFNCMMARTLRKRLKKIGIRKGFLAVYSEELPNEESLELTDGTNFKKSYYGTISYMPALFGIHCASATIRQILE